MIKFAKVNSVKGGRTTDDKNIVLTINFVSIVADTPTDSISNNFKHIDIPRSIKYRLFEKGNVKIKQLIYVVDDIN